MRDSELARLMAGAAAKATEACLAKGYSRTDEVTRKSAFAAADEVYRRHVPVEVAPPEDGWRERADVDG